MSHYFKIMASLGLVLTLAACETPEGYRQLASNTGATIAMASAQTGAFAATAKEAARERAHLTALMEANSQELANQAARELAVWRMSAPDEKSMPKKVRFYEAIRAQAEKDADEANALRDMVAGVEKDIFNGYTAITAPTETLSEASKNLVLLGQKKTPGERLFAFALFALSVNDKLVELEAKQRGNLEMVKGAAGGEANKQVVQQSLALKPVAAQKPSGADVAALTVLSKDVNADLLLGLK